MLSKVVGVGEHFASSSNSAVLMVEVVLEALPEPESIRHRYLCQAQAAGGHAVASGTWDS